MSAATLSSGTNVQNYPPLDEANARKLLDFSQKFDIGLLDRVVTTMYMAPGQNQQKMAQEVLTNLKEHPDAWTKVMLIFDHNY